MPTISRPGFFNMTASFRDDSDFPVNIFQVDRRGIPCDKCLEDEVGLLSGKTKFLSWIVSHCETPGKRERYMAELSKYLGVDIFGKCGKPLPECNRKVFATDCTSDIMKGYKFYFAAENSICKDYFTGKK